MRRLFKFEFLTSQLPFKACHFVTGIVYSLHMKRIYVETTVVSYYTARPSRDLMVAAYQQATREVWPRLLKDYRAYVSALVYTEAQKGNAHFAKQRLEAIAAFDMIEIDEVTRELGTKIVRSKGVPSQYAEDALHIAACARHGIDVLLTWNFAHLNNPFTRSTLRRAVESAGYELPEICSPIELQEEKL